MPSVPADSVGPPPEGAVTDAGVGYVATSSCMQGGRQLVQNVGGVVDPGDGAALTAGDARGDPPASSPLCVPPVATDAVGTDAAIATMPPVIVLAIHYHSGPCQLVVKWTVGI